MQKARRDFQRSLQEGRHKRVKSADANTKGLLGAGRVKEAWDHLVRWYCQVRGRQAHPTKEGMDQVSEYRAEIYICWPPEGLQNPLLVHQEAVNNDILAEAENEMAVRGLKEGRSGGGHRECTWMI